MNAMVDESTDHGLLLRSLLEIVRNVVITSTCVLIKIHFRSFYWISPIEYKRMQAHSPIELDNQQRKNYKNFSFNIFFFCLQKS